MIIRPDGPPVDVDRFLQVIADAARSVVRLNIAFWPQGGPRGSATAWHVTDDLLVTASAGLRTGPIELNGTRGEARGTATPIFGSEAADDFALLRVDRPTQGAAASLFFDAPSAGASLWLLHHPGGQPRATVSLGSIVELAGGQILHDANTEPGSAGAPLFDLFGRVVGMHMVSLPTRKLNRARSLGEMVSWLRGSPAWGEIADHHRILGGAPTTPRQSTPELSTPLLTALSLRWSFDPATLADDERRVVEALVIDARAPRWTLPAPLRRRGLEAVASFEALRGARAGERSAEPGQRVIDHILEGPPFNLWTEAFALLPYWLQAVRWFKDLIPGLPTAAEVQRALERRRVREQLRALTGGDFHGRKTDLGKIGAWFADEEAGALVISGIGGIGKSALVARFAELRPPETLLLWLDFDRPDLAPDAADSIVRALAEQCRAQIEGPAPAIEPTETWQAFASRLGKAVVAEASQGTPPLLVLDSFEIAQHATRYQELWPVVELFAHEIPSLRIIVTGRAPVEGLVIDGRRATSLTLDGLSTEDADAFLRAKHIDDAEVRKRVLEIARGIPLVLMLAIRFVATGGTIASLPEQLPKHLLEGYIYDRILDRVVDPALRPLSRGVLVLRKVTTALLDEVLRPLLPEGMGAADALKGLRHELSLVDGDTVLRVRPELRAATLRLLTSQDPAFVQRIEQAAESFYARQTQDDVAAAELVYHRLRLGDLTGAKAAFRPRAAKLLLDAQEVLEEPAHDFLAGLLGVVPVPEATLAGWETDALNRIRGVLSRGHADKVEPILQERSERSEDSPLVFYDAWVRATAGDRVGALSLLGAERPPESSILRDRAVLRAWIVAATDAVAADGILAPLARPDQAPSDEAEALVDAAIGAARLRMTFRIDEERTLLEDLHVGSSEALARDVARGLTPEDVLDRGLRHWLWSPSGLESVWSTTSVELTDEAHRRRLLDGLTGAAPLSGLHGLFLRTLEPYAKAPVRVRVTELLALLSDDDRRFAASLPERVLDLALAAFHRWALLATSATAERVSTVVTSAAPWRLLSASMAFSLVCLHETPGWRITPRLRGRSSRLFLGDSLRRLADASFAVHLAAKLGPVVAADGATGGGEPSRQRARAAELLSALLLRGRSSSDAWGTLEQLDELDLHEVFLAAANLVPDPLDLLVRRLAGLDDASS